MPAAAAVLANRRVRAAGAARRMAASMVEHVSCGGAGMVRVCEAAEGGGSRREARRVPAAAWCRRRAAGERQQHRRPAPWACRQRSRLLLMRLWARSAARAAQRRAAAVKPAYRRGGAWGWPVGARWRQGRPFAGTGRQQASFGGPASMGIHSWQARGPPRRP